MSKKATRSASELGQVTPRKSKLVDELSQARKEAIESRNEAIEMQKSKEAAEFKVQNLKRENSRLKNEVKSLKEQLEQSSVLIEDKNNMLAKLQEQYEELEGKLTDLDGDRSLQEDLESIIEDNKQKLLDLEKENKEFAEQVDYFTRRQLSSEEEIIVLKQSLQEKINTILEYTSENNETDKIPLESIRMLVDKIETVHKQSTTILTYLGDLTSLHVVPDPTLDNTGRELIANAKQVGDIEKLEQCGEAEDTFGNYTILCEFEEKSNMEEMLDRIYKVVNLKNGTYRINKFRKTFKGLAIDLATKRECTSLLGILMEKKEECKGFRCFSPRLKEPQFMLRNLTGYEDKEGVKEDIISRNMDISADDLKMDFDIVVKRGKHYIFSVKPDLYKRLMAHPFIYIGVERYRVTEFISVRKCSLCGRLGHTRGTCKTGQDCQICGEAGEHDTTKCTMNCANCVENNKRFGSNFDTLHSLKSLACPTFLLWQERARRNILYS